MKKLWEEHLLEKQQLKSQLQKRARDAIDAWTPALDAESDRKRARNA